MKRRTFLKRTAAASLVTLITPSGLVQAFRPSFAGSLEQGFKNPPPVSRTQNYWFWMNGNITKRGITLDLEAMQRVGMGGVQCFNVGNAIPKGPVDYLSPEWVELTKHAMNEAGRLNLEFSMHNCPGWSSSGGPWVTPELGMQQIVWKNTYITGGTEIIVKLPQPTTVRGFYKDTYVLAYPTLEGEEQGNPYIIDGLLRKANFPLKVAGQNPFLKGRPVSADTKLTPGTFIDPAKVLNISQQLGKDGTLKWKAPKGKWTVLRLGHTVIDRENRAAPESGIGLEVDKYRSQALDFHFNKLLEKLMPVVRQWANKTKVGLLIDSYEVGLQNWTPAMAAEFEKRRGYDFVKYLPAVTGRIVGDLDITERFLWDFRRTHADLIAQNYYGRFAELCRQNGMTSYVEPYSEVAPFDQMEVGSKVDITMGEFWGRGSRLFSTDKLASSIAHVFGKYTDGRQIVGAEAFTGDPRHSKWMEHPYTMKSQGDFMFTSGVTRYIFHRYAHQPHSTARPGMTMGQFGFHYDRTNTWFEQSRSWLTYINRCQNVLQQGVFCADILYYAGETVPSDKLSHTVEPNPAPPKGYDWNWANKDVLTRIRIQNNAISLPGGPTYKMLVLIPKKDMSLEVLQTLRELVNQGMVLVGNPPERTPGLQGHQKNEAALQQLVRELWGDSPAAVRKVGAGTVFRYQPLDQVVAQLNLKPDFEFTSKSGDAEVNFIHRTIAGGEVYFIGSRRRLKEDLTATFRVTGKQPELWDAATGEINKLEVFDQIDGRTVVPLQLDPSGSCFIVFREPVASTSIKSIEKDGTALVSTQDFRRIAPGRYRDVTANFTLTAWVKPEVDDQLDGRFEGKQISSHLFYPPEGEVLYGEGHAACGMVVARNGIIVSERAKGGLSKALIVPLSLSGWTHVALVYKDNVPSVYVNGKFISAGKKSRKIVHPGVGDFKQDYSGWLFEGDLNSLEVTKEALSAERIQQLAQIPDKGPEQPGSVSLASGQPGLLFWENGNYTLRTNKDKALTAKISGIDRPTVLSGEWTVNFPPNLGAPAKTVLPQLISLHKHQEDGVKYFSGTATYTKEFTVPANALDNGKRLFLDLGRVEVIAEVKVNGKDLGIFWKPPFLVEITNAVKKGRNSLEVQVTNQWPNRLIGDEQLPPENKYEGRGENSTGVIQKLPDWYVQDKPKPAGGRVAFSTFKHFLKDSPLLEAGLIGPVVLRSAVQHKV
ncbi:glycosyl hydrolase [Rufibacter ruber]|uniref:glycosyl hydrolase n=1 Tax=Rufibacter ruber TaxID=1783499 RepID=UPI000831493D|nr:glycosyl hydrolase [Rufibacter ruber]